MGVFNSKLLVYQKVLTMVHKPKIHPVSINL